MKGTTWRASLCVAAAMAVAACSSSQKAQEPEWQQGETPKEQKSALSPGGAKLYLQKGVTTQAQVTEVFGPPDLVTHKDDMQIWTYDKTSYDYEKRSDYVTAIFIGAGGDRVRSSSRSTMLIVYFDTNDRVVDYRLSSIKY